MRIHFPLIAAALVLLPLAAAGVDAGLTAKAVPEPAPDAGVRQPAPEEPIAPAIPKERMPTIALKVTPKEVSIGEVVHWRVTIKRKKEDRVHLGSGASFGGLEIKEKNKSEKPLDAEWVEETLDVGLIGFEAGDVVIPPQKLSLSPY